MSSPIPLWGWVLFVAVVVGLLLVDLLVLHRDAHVVRTREAALWSVIWIGLGLAFSGIVALIYTDAGRAVGEYLSGYLIEKSLSVDNLFVFVLIFAYFSVPDAYQHRVLFWGILGALVFRGVFIAVGAVLLARFSWVAYLFGAFLVFTGVRLATHDEVEVHPERNPVLKLLRHLFRITPDYEGQAMFVRREGALWATPLFAVLVVVESTDVVFAVDSIPAIFGVTRDPFLVFSSNAFALLGLRALYFLLASAVRRFRYLGPGVASVLVLVGIKLILEEATDVHFPAWQPLTIIALILGTSVWLSLRVERRDGGGGVAGDPPDDREELETHP
ncbi:MAG: TerC family protein [Actinobacteria bacterium]|nr:TerC family protein [Actinomycetota bacterium]